MFVTRLFSRARTPLIIAGAVLGLSMNAAQAATYTGTVQYYFTQDSSGGTVYTFANLSPGVVCYYIGTNTALASIFATTQNAGGTVTMNCDSSNKITQVAN